MLVLEFDFPVECQVDFIHTMGARLTLPERYG